MNAFIEALKEAARIVLMSIIPIILLGFDSRTRTVHIDWFLVQFTAVVTLLRFVDSYLHQQGKAKDNDILKGGLTRF